jgi:hypothetical protein
VSTLRSNAWNSSSAIIVIICPSLLLLLLLLLPQVCYPKPTDKPLYNGLVTQCKALGIPFLSLEQLQAACSQPASQQQLGSSSRCGLSAVADVVVDALFGFSFKGSPRPPFDSLLQVSADQKSDSVPELSLRNVM